MNAKQLKDSILQYAMQGKLVPQNPNDEPASELLKRIAEEKQRLVKEGVIKKEKPLPPITEEEIPFDIPDSWEWVRLKELGYITSGGTPKTAEVSYWNNGDIVWITPSDMGKNKGKFLSNSERKITIEGLKNSSAQLIPKNSIVYSSRAPIGHINIVECDFSTNQGCKSITPLITDITFLYYALICMTPEIQKKASGTTFKEISGTVFGESLIPLPPLNEQIQIVLKMEQLFSKIENYEAAYDEADKLKKRFPINLEKSILQYAMQGKLVEQDPHDEPAQLLIERIQAEKERLIKEKVIKKEKPLPPITEEEIPFDIPSSWEWVRLNTVVDVRDGTHDTPKYVDKGYPLVTGKDFYNGVLNFEKTKYISKEDYLKIVQRSKVDIGDILFSMIGGNIGSMVLIDEELEIAIKNVALFKRYCEKSVLPKFLLYFLRANIENFKIIAKGGAQSFVSLKILREYLIPLPALNEQERIVQAIEKIMGVKNQLIQ